MLATVPMNAKEIINLRTVPVSDYSFTLYYLQDQIDLLVKNRGEKNRKVQSMVRAFNVLYTMAADTPYDILSNPNRHAIVSAKFEMLNLVMGVVDEYITASELYSDPRYIMQMFKGRVEKMKDDLGRKNVRKS